MVLERWCGLQRDFSRVLRCVLGSGRTYWVVLSPSFEETVLLSTIIVPTNDPHKFKGNFGRTRFYSMLLKEEPSNMEDLRSVDESSTTSEGDGGVSRR